MNTDRNNPGHAVPDDGPEGVDPYELVERVWPYDGPYSAEHTTAAAVMIGRLVRYLNNATQKPDGLRYAATSGRVVAHLQGAVAGQEQLLTQLARFLDREADSNPSLYDDRRDRPGAVTARQASAALLAAIGAVRALDAALGEPAGLAYHLGSD